MEVQRVPAKGRIVKFLRLFDFSVQGAGVKITVGLPKGSASGAASSNGAASSSGASSSAAVGAVPPRNYLGALLTKQFKK